MMATGHLLATADAIVSSRPTGSLQRWHRPIN
ncbi:MAG: hypothetical protein ACI8P9_004076 [Parasphingorhabdus sp.]|jgi:hypothetical protein